MRKAEFTASNSEREYLRQTPGYGVLRKLVIGNVEEARATEVPSLPPREHFGPPPVSPEEEEGGEEEAKPREWEESPYAFLLTKVQNEVAEALRGYLLEKTLSNLVEGKDKVTAVSNELTLGEASSLLEESNIEAAPVFKNETMDTMGIIDGPTALLFLVTEPRPSYMEEFEKNDSSLVWSKSLGYLFEKSKGKGFDPFVTIDSGHDVLQLAKQFTELRDTEIGRAFAHQSCVLTDGAISHMVTQLDLIRFIHKNYDTIFGDLNPKVVELQAIVPKVWCVADTDTLVSAFLSIAKHKISSVAVVDGHSKSKLVGEISADSLRGISKTIETNIRLPIGVFLEKNKGKGLDHTTCESSVHLKELLKIMVEQKAKRVWVVRPRFKVFSKRMLGVVTITSLLRSLIGAAPLYDDQEELRKKKQLQKAAVVRDAL